MISRLKNAGNNTYVKIGAASGSKLDKTVYVNQAG